MCRAELIKKGYVWGGEIYVLFFCFLHFQMKTATYSTRPSFSKKKFPPLCSFTSYAPDFCYCKILRNVRIFFRISPSSHHPGIPASRLLFSPSRTLLTCDQAEFSHRFYLVLRGRSLKLLYFVSRLPQECTLVTRGFFRGMTS